MKYFIDTEFIEGFHKPLFGKSRHFIDLISIGMVSEDNRALHFISNEYDYNKADDWVKKNVIDPLYVDTVHGDMRNRLSINNFHKYYGVSNKQIANEIIDFTTVRSLKPMGLDLPELNRWQYDQPEFYAYYADYDWVLFCSLFGQMLDLPKGFPMYCIDLKQILDEKVSKLKWQYGRDIWSNSKRSIETIGYGPCQEKDRPATFEEKLKVLKELDEYPKQHNEHNALADAAWNKELYNFLQTI